MIDCWLLITDCWLLMSDYWLLIADYWLLIIDEWLLIADYWWVITDCWLLITDCWLLMSDYWLLIADCWLFASSSSYSKFLMIDYHFFIRLPGFKAVCKMTVSAIDVAWNTSLPEKSGLGVGLLPINGSAFPSLFASFVLLLEGCYDRLIFCCHLLHFIFVENNHTMVFFGNGILDNLVNIQSAKPIGQTTILVP